jgi:hypothetical protein
MTFVLSTVRQTIHFGLCTALITKAKALRSNCKCIAKLAVDQTWRILYSVHQKQLRKQSSSFFLKKLVLKRLMLRSVHWPFIIL